jgi:hypothetical protein
MCSASTSGVKVGSFVLLALKIVNKHVVKHSLERNSSAMHPPVPWHNIFALLLRLFPSVLVQRVIIYVKKQCLEAVAARTY